jgi:hypothetical protein
LYNLVSVIASLAAKRKYLLSCLRRGNFGKFRTACRVVVLLSYARCSPVALLTLLGIVGEGADRSCINQRARFRLPNFCAAKWQTSRPVLIILQSFIPLFQPLCHTFSTRFGSDRWSTKVRLPVECAGTSSGHLIEHNLKGSKQNRTGMQLWSSLFAELGFIMRDYGLDNSSRFLRGQTGSLNDAEIWVGPNSRDNNSKHEM